MSQITLEPGVTYEKYPTGTLVGVYLPNTPRHFMCAGFEFNNPFSANMFAYLKQRHGVAMAKEAVVKVEEKITGSSAGKEAFKTIAGIVDWKSLMTGNPPAALLGTLKNAVSTACDLALGAAVKAALQQGYGRYNPYPPVNEGILWVGDSIDDQFVSYAIGYWRKNPADGYAYRSSGELM